VDWRVSRRFLGTSLLIMVGGSLDEFAVDEAVSGTDQAHEVGCVDGSPAGLGLDSISLNVAVHHTTMGVDIGGDLGLQRRRQHLPGTVANDLNVKDRLTTGVGNTYEQSERPPHKKEQSTA
jgi:hypothetical protein